jgi:N,N'-diacetyllegionaminate synthase
MQPNKIFIISEIGSVHDGSFGNALKLIEMAAYCGVDGVKFQTHIAEAETINNAPSPPYFSGEPRYDYFKRTSFTFEQWIKIKEHCLNHNVEFISSPFSIEAVDFLENVGVQKYKIPSGEVTNLSLLEKVAKTGKQIILSSGMSTWDELDDAIYLIRQYHDNIIILQCTSEYPCPPERVGLNILDEMRTRYGLPVGFSDHTLTPYAGYAAVVLGAKVIERHVTFSRMMYGSDAKHSIEPNELKEFVKGVRNIESLLHTKVDKNNLSRLHEMKNIFEKSIVTKVDIAKGTIITEEMVCFKKPGTGIPAKKLHEIIGKKALKNIPSDILLSFDDFC